MAAPKKFHDAHSWRIEGAGGEEITWAITAGPFKFTHSTTEVPDGRGRLRDLPSLEKMDQFDVMLYASASKALYDRYRVVRNASTGKGTIETDVFEDLDFVLEDRDGSDLERIRVYKAAPIAYAIDSLDKKKTDKLGETITFCASYFDRV